MMKENSLTYKSQMYSDSGRDRPLHYKYDTFHEPCPLQNPISDIANRRQKRSHTTISNHTIQLHVSQFILYISFGVFNPTPKYV